MANAGINESRDLLRPSVVDGKPAKPITKTLDVNINGVVYSACYNSFSRLLCFDDGQATSLALHYLEISRTSPSDLKAIVVMGSMGEVEFGTLSSVCC